MSSLVQHFDQSVSQGLMDDVLQVIIQAYEQAHDHIREIFAREEQHDLLPHYRRGLIETNLRNIALRHDGVTAIAPANSRRSSYHTRLQVGDVIITESAVDSRLAMVRWAEFRETYARIPQLSLFEEDNPQIEDGPLYAILLHGPLYWDPSRPGFVDIAFPDDMCSQYLDHIDLLDRCARATVNDEGTEIIGDLAVKVREIRKNMERKA